MFRMERTLPTAVITDIFAECPVDGLIGALADLQLTKRPSTPGTRFMRRLSHGQSPRIRPSIDVPNFSAISIAM